jgi:hypothetical protein
MSRLSRVLLAALLSFCTSSALNEFHVFINSADDRSALFKAVLDVLLLFCSLVSLVGLEPTNPAALDGRGLPFSVTKTISLPCWDKDLRSQ